MEMVYICTTNYTLRKLTYGKRYKMIYRVDGNVSVIADDGSWVILTEFYFEDPILYRIRKINEILTQ